MYEILTGLKSMDLLTDLFYSEKYLVYRNVAAVVGVLVVVRICLRFLSDMCSGFQAFFLSPLGIGGANLLKYGKWAVVTGASEGIGRGYALELARRGFNVVLMSRSKEKLDKVASEIETEYKRECKVLPVDFNDGLEIYSRISDEIRNLDVGMLVNNVGMSYPYPDRFGNHPAEMYYKLVHLNCHPIVQMTHLVLPKMVKQGGGYIINLSSIAYFGPFPQLFVYSATKKFIQYVSDGIRKEYCDKGIHVQTVTPHLVSTAMTGNMRVRFIVSSPISYAKAAVATIGIQKTTYGYFPHAIYGYIAETIPTLLADYQWNKACDRSSRVKFLREQERKKKN